MELHGAHSAEVQGAEGAAAPMSGAPTNLFSPQLPLSAQAEYIEHQEHKWQECVATLAWLSAGVLDARRTQTLPVAL